MKLGATIFVFFILLSVYAFKRNTDNNSMKSKSGNIQIVEGLLYIDGKPVSIKIVDGKIANIRHLSSESDIPKMYVAPGLVDIQINGYMGIDFASQDLTIEGIKEATKALWKEGVTTFLPTLITADKESLKKQFFNTFQITGR